MRDFSLNLSPHGLFAAKFRTLLRDMIVREQGNDVHLLSCVSPEWIQVGKANPASAGTNDIPPSKCRLADVGR